MGLPLMNLIRLNGVPILRQLHLEEKLMRTSSENWCIINDGTIKPTIVMGISGKPQELLETESVLQDEIPVIRRMSGGGTVIVDQDTVFVTFICNKGAVPGLKPDPQRIIHWTGHLYKKVFNGRGADFSVCENDYVLDGRKFGGNALSITSKRWLQHTSFLWDYKMSNMSYLKVPLKAPKYRQVLSLQKHSSSTSHICMQSLKLCFPGKESSGFHMQHEGLHISVGLHPRHYPSSREPFPVNPISPGRELVVPPV